MKRRELRENIFKIIFSLNSEKEFSEEAFSYYLEDNGISEKDGEFIKSEVLGIVENSEAIDSIISENLKNYTFERISKVCLAVLRVAIYEINYVTDIPDAVAASEAVKIVEAYEDEKSKGFINGILGSVIRKKSEGIEWDRQHTFSNRC